jgi:hypothetical protein
MSYIINEINTNKDCNWNIYVYKACIISLKYDSFIQNWTNSGHGQHEEGEDRTKMKLFRPVNP